ncbi:hypothetical protein ACFL5M_00895 [Candidatus Neomarinimicrobiota bacterium]
MYYTKQISLLISSIVFLFAGVSCYRFELSSAWTNEPVAIDGDDSEWTIPRKVLEGEQGVVGFMNDNTYLYISYRTSSRARIQQIVTQGLTLWIDPKGGTGKRIGFRYPIGSKLLGISPWDYDPRPRTTGYQAFIEQLLLLQPGIEILGRRKEDVALVPHNNQAGLKVEVRMTKDLFVYEMRIPYGKKATLPRPIGATPRQKIGVGLVGGPIHTDDWNKRPGEGGMGINEPGRSVGPGSRSEDRMGRPEAGTSEIWISVTIADESKTSK